VIVDGHPAGGAMFSGSDLITDIWAGWLRLHLCRFRRLNEATETTDVTVLRAFLAQKRQFLLIKVSEESFHRTTSASVLRRTASEHTMACAPVEAAVEFRVGCAACVLLL